MKLDKHRFDVRLRNDASRCKWMFDGRLSLLIEGKNKRRKRTQMPGRDNKKREKDAEASICPDKSRARSVCRKGEKFCLAFDVHVCLFFSSDKHQLSNVETPSPSRDGVMTMFFARSSTLELKRMHFVVDSVTRDQEKKKTTTATMRKYPERPGER